MASLEELASQQTSFGKTIERLWSNYKKDGPSRWKPEYLQSKLEELEKLWSAFEDNDKSMSIYKGTNMDHLYFTQGYFSQVKKLYEEFKAVVLTTISKCSSNDNTSTGDQTKATVSEYTVKGGFSAAEETQEENGVGNFDEEQQRLIRKQKASMAALERFIRAIEVDINQAHSHSYYKLKVNFIMDYWQKISELHSEILSIGDNPLDYNEAYYSEMEARCQETLLTLQERGETNQSGAEMNRKNQLKLPKISIPKFDGNYLKWQQFHDIYEQLVHKGCMSKSEKMFYLKANLTDEASRLIQHLQVAEENYEGAWDLVKNRYNNQRMLVAALLNKLLSQSLVSVETASSLKHIHDTTKEALLAIQNLGVPTKEWGPLVLHILLHKVSAETHRLFEQSLSNPKEIPSLDAFFKLIETRFQTLESVERKEKPDHRGISKTAKKGHSLLTSNSMKCAMCKRSDHHIYACPEFTKLSPVERLRQVKKLRLCINCLKGDHTYANCRSGCCPKCNKRHNRLLHISTEAGVAQISPSSQGQGTATNLSVRNLQETNAHFVFLATASVHVYNRSSQKINCRALLDSGSQLNFVTEKLYKSLGVKAEMEHLQLAGIGDHQVKIQRRVNIKIKSLVTNYTANIEAFVLPQIASYQPTKDIQAEQWPIPQNIQLADKEFYKSKSIDLLLGAEIYSELMTIGQMKIGADLPTLQNTTLGWIVLGKATSSNAPAQFCGIGLAENRDSIEDQLQKFWTIEEVETTKHSITSHEQKCEDFFNATYKRNSEGRFLVKLPFQHASTNLGKSEDIAIRRFLALEKKLEKNSTIKKEYIKFIKEYIQLGHMEAIDRKSIPQQHLFLPHHCVLKPDSSTTKLRVVFDASAKTSTNYSLNDVLHTGPAIQEELFNVLIRFRYVFTADIEKMYRQIMLDDEDRNFQLILWRDDPSEEIKVYRLNTITYGTASASYLSTKCLHTLADQEGKRYSNDISQIIKRCFYVDDVMTGANSLEETQTLKRHLTEILSSGGFKLRKWCANNPELLKDIAKEDLEPQLNIEDGDEGCIKTLGMTWLPSSDKFIMKSSPTETKRVTKRSILADIAHLFDPLGLVNPVIVRAKIILQKLWQLKLDWDAAIPMEMHTQWMSFKEELAELKAIKIPRLAIGKHQNVIVQIHAFSDASERAYGTAIYLRSVDASGDICIQLLCAKSRVAPLKTTTLPRLELCAAVMMAQLIHRLKRSLDITISETFYWTDSEIVLSWLNSESANYKTFVANRISTIQQVSKAQQWRHVGTKDNPADLVSRGAMPVQLIESKLWFRGPKFLHTSIENWPSQERIQPNSDLECKKVKHALAVRKDETHFIRKIDHRNSFNHLVRITAHILRFTKIVKQKGESRSPPRVSIAELDEAQKVIIRHLQNTHFREELVQIKRQGHVDASSRLSCLSAFIDDTGILRVGGRLQSSNLPYNAKHPVLLPYDDIITTLIMTEVHQQNMHAGPQALLAITRQRFWPIKGKNIAQAIFRRCVRCTHVKPRLLTQIMGNLPASRVQPAKPFFNSGVDFGGPIYTHYKVRGKRPTKSYIAVFCCFATKAAHLELVTDLSSSGFIGALKRFISRRGRCQNIYCDNATNFVGASNLLSELAQLFEHDDVKDKISKACSSKGINFHFIPPRAPHFGGLWEAAVKSAKTLLHKSMGSASLTYEELETAIIEIEAVLNSRPLTPMSNDPNDLTALTPGHFLVGEPLTAVADANTKDSKASQLSRWKLVSYVKHEFWRRWSREYLSELQQRHKWKGQVENIKPGTMVIIKEDNLPPLKWPLGRIVNAIAGDDHIVRVVDVRTSTGVYRRPITRLAPLPIEDDADTNSNRTENYEQLATKSKKPQGIRTSLLCARQVTQNDRSTKRKLMDGDAHQKPRKVFRIRPVTGYKSLILNLIMLFFVGLGACSHHITHPDPGIYIEDIGIANLKRGLLRINLNFKADIDDDTNRTNTVVREMQELCDGSKRLDQDANCDLLVHNLREKQNKILQEIQIVAQHRIRRKRRGLFGKMLQAVFGVNDEVYADIDHLNENQEKLMQITNHQANLMLSTVAAVNDTEFTLTDKMNKFNEKLNKALAVINDMQPWYADIPIANGPKLRVPADKSS